MFFFRQSYPLRICLKSHANFSNWRKSKKWQWSKFERNETTCIYQIDHSIAIVIIEPHRSSSISRAATYSNRSPKWRSRTGTKQNMVENFHSFYVFVFWLQIPQRNLQTMINGWLISFRKLLLKKLTALLVWFHVIIYLLIIAASISFSKNFVLTLFISFCILCAYLDWEKRNSLRSAGDKYKNSFVFLLKFWCDLTPSIHFHLFSRLCCDGNL